MNKYKNVLDLSAKEAKDFFLQSENYCTLMLPQYIQFQPLLNALDKFLKDKKQGDYIGEFKPREVENLNNIIYHSKDGQYQWRPLQIIHPVLYLELLNVICEDSNWNIIKQRFALFQHNPKIFCTSIPIQNNSSKTSTASVILNWWEQMEQKIIADSLNFSYIYTTDITDFYPSIYTHTISWALHGKQKSKQERVNKKLLGNKIDCLMQDMHNAQTNGIPQGSALMDFIAEMVLGYADLLLSKKLEENGITKYKIFRYRDDYKILVDNPKEGEMILKFLTEILLDLNLKLNTSKTKKNADIISSAIKQDKLAWFAQSNFMGLLNPSYRCRLENKEWQFINRQKTLLGIYQFANQYPNSGTIAKLLLAYCQKLQLTKLDNIPVLISILISIMMNSPRWYPQESEVLSLLLMEIPQSKRMDILVSIRHKLDEKPHTDLLDIWLQRISWKINPVFKYSPKICQLVANPKEVLWDISWLSNETKQIFSKNSIVNTQVLDKMPFYIEDKEVNAFTEYSY